MNYNTLKYMHSVLDGYIKMDFLKNKYIVIFGSNEPAERMAEYLLTKNLVVNSMVDNNKRKEGTIVAGITISLPQNTLLPKKDNIVILIASKYYSEMVMQLNQMGYEEGKEIIKVLDISRSGQVSLSEEEFEKCCEKVKQGKKIYVNILARCPDAQKILVCPLGLLGDTYVALTYLREYLEKNNITKYLLVQPKSASVKISAMFGFEKNVVAIDGAEVFLLLDYAVFDNMADGRILIMNQRLPFTRRLGELNNYKGINFIDYYKYSIFGLGEDSRPEKPSAIKNSVESKQYVDDLFEEYGLKKGNTVILFPYAKTATSLDVSFWERLAEELKNKGYIVCTNCGGDGEPEINGTIKLFFDLRYSIETVEEAGCIVGLRSGLCDVISTANAKKIIIYPDRIYGAGTFIDNFSLVKMELCNDAIEVVWNGTTDYMIDEILRYIDN